MRDPLTGLPKVCLGTCTENNSKGTRIEIISFFRNFHNGMVCLFECLNQSEYFFFLSIIRAKWVTNIYRLLLLLCLCMCFIHVNIKIILRIYCILSRYVWSMAWICQCTKKGGTRLNFGCGLKKKLITNWIWSVLTWYHALNLWEDQIIFKLIDLKIDCFKARQLLGY